jgi:hypothetical protein
MTDEDLVAVGREVMRRLEDAYGKGRRGDVEIAWVVAIEREGADEVVYGSNHKRLRDTAELFALAAEVSQEDLGKGLRARRRRRFFESGA